MKTDKQRGNRVCSIVQLSTERLPNLPPPATHTHLLPFPFMLSFSLCRGFFPFPPLILRWLDLICMYLHNESHLHAQGQTVP